MTIKKTLLKVFSFILLLSLVSCSGESSTLTSPITDDSTSVQTEDSTESPTEIRTETPTESPTEKPIETPILYKRTVNVIDKMGGYLRGNTIDAYFEKDSNIPYLGFSSYLTLMGTIFGEMNIEVDIVDGIGLYKDTIHEHYMTIDTINDIITQDNNSFFAFKNNYDDLYSSLDLEFSSLVDTICINDVQDEYVMDISKYGYDAVLQDNEIYLPYSLINTMFAEEAFAFLVWNNKDFVAFYGYIELDDYQSCITPELVDTQLSKEMVDERNKQLYFFLDNYYGLKDELGYEDFADFFINNPDIVEGLSSIDPVEANLAMVKLFHKTLNDVHTNLISYNFYDNVISKEDLKPLIPYELDSTKYIELIDTLNNLISLYDKTFNDSKYFRIENTTAFIKFDTFLANERKALLDKTGKFYSDAYQYDSYALVCMALEKIQRNPNVKNIVIDLSQNTGGEIAVVKNILGLFTNENIAIAQENVGRKTSFIYNYKIDANHDGNYDDDDAFDQYNYYILTSPVTFSAANYLTATAKSMGSAKIIGQKSGGGKCAVGVLPFVDGTFINHSSNTVMGGYNKDAQGKYEMYSTENGIDVDYELPLEKFYDLKYIDQFINNL